MKRKVFLLRVVDVCPPWVLAAVGLGVLASCLSSCVYPTGPIPWSHWRSTEPAHISTPVAEKVDRLEAHLIDRHLSPEGVLIYRRPDEPFRLGVPGSHTNLADETIWTGCLVAAWAYKYAVTGEEADRYLLLRALRGLRLLREVTGVPGLFARAIAPSATTFLRREKPHQEWRDAPPPLVGYRYRGDVSKDQYFGALLGYAVTALALDLGPDRGDPEIRALVGTAVRAVADHIWRHGLRIVDVDGETTRFGDLSGHVFGVPIGPNAALCLAWQLLAWRLEDHDVYRQRYLELVDRGYAAATAWNKFQFLGMTNHNNDVMAMMGLHALCGLEPRDEIRRIYRENIAGLWALVRHEGNLLYHAVYAAAGAPLPADARVDVEETMRLFPVDAALRAVDLRDHPLVDRAFLDGRHDAPRNRTALPLHLRPRSSFVWKSSPHALVGNLSWRGEMTVSGVDFVLVYWMARHHGLVSP